MYKVKLDVKIWYGFSISLNYKQHHIFTFNNLSDTFLGQNVF